MKNLMLATAAAVMGFATLAQDASAAPRFEGRNTRRVAGAVINPIVARPVRVAPIVAAPGIIGAVGNHYHVTYHMDGSRRMHFNSHSAAHRYEDYLKSLGCHVKLIHNAGHYDVVYHMHGSKSRTFTSHAAAHAFEQRLTKLGLHAKVVHH